jgi:hypothetical protein
MRALGQCTCDTVQLRRRSRPPICHPGYAAQAIDGPGLRGEGGSPSATRSTNQRSQVCSDVRQCVAMCGNVRQCVAMCGNQRSQVCSDVRQCAAMGGNVRQCGATRGNVCGKCAAMSGNVWQSAAMCGAVCGNGRQRVQGAAVSRQCSGNVVAKGDPRQPSTCIK